MDQKNFDTSEEPLFLKVRSRDTVLVGENEICKVLSFTGGSRDPDAPSLFQVANVDTGEIKHVHAAEVKEIVCRGENENLHLTVEMPLSNFLPTVVNYERKVNKKKFIEQLNELNTDKTEPLSSILNEPLRSRKDVVNDGKIREKILENSPQKNEEFFVVPKVIE